MCVFLFHSSYKIISRKFTICTNVNGKSGLEKFHLNHYNAAIDVKFSI